MGDSDDTRLVGRNTEHMSRDSGDANASRLEALRELYPEAFAEGRVDLEKLGADPGDDRDEELPDLQEATVRALQVSVDDLFVCRDVALSDSLAANLALQCRLKTI